jgi:hypothetical protein
MISWLRESSGFKDVTPEVTKLCFRIAKALLLRFT